MKCYIAAMTRRRFDKMNCSIAQSMEVLGDKWTLLIIRDCFVGVRRFSDFQENLGISKNILATRLQHLVEYGVLRKVEVQNRGSKFEYELTTMGKDLFTTVTALRQWGDRWIAGQGNEPILVEDIRTGKPIPEQKVYDYQGEPIKGKYLRTVPGPGANEETTARLQQESA